MTTGEVRALKRAAMGQSLRAEDLAAAIAFVRQENDGSDFRLVTLLRLRLGYGARLEPAADVVEFGGHALALDAAADTRRIDGVLVPADPSETASVTSQRCELFGLVVGISGRRS